MLNVVIAHFNKINVNVNINIDLSRQILRRIITTTTVIQEVSDFDIDDPDVGSFRTRQTEYNQTLLEWVVILLILFLI